MCRDRSQVERLPSVEPEGVVAVGGRQMGESQTTSWGPTGPKTEKDNCLFCVIWPLWQTGVDLCPVLVRGSLWMSTTQLVGKPQGSPLAVHTKKMGKNYKPAVSTLVTSTSKLEN